MGVGVVICVIVAVVFGVGFNFLRYKTHEKHISEKTESNSIESNSDSKKDIK